MSFGCDGVKVPVITDAEKKHRRAKVQEKRQQLKAEGQALTQRASLDSDAKKKALNGLLHDMAERSPLIHYPEFRAKGWQTGSGATEAQCGTTTDRINGRGRRGNPENALALMALKALHQSHAWSSYWNLN